MAMPPFPSTRLHPSLAARAQGSHKLLARLLALFVPLCLLLMPAPPLQAAAVSNAIVKAGFITNFARYTRWPLNHPANEDKTPPELILCVLGNSDTAHEVLKLSGHSLNGYTLRTRTVSFPGKLKLCHVLYIEPTPLHRLKPLLATLKDLPVLTISDTPDFIHYGGMVGLYQENKRLRFEINLNSVTTARLSMSYKLPKLASHVLQNTVKFAAQ